MKFGRAIPTAIRIVPTDSHGFIVDVGFATFACETPEAVLSILKPYLEQPSGFISDFNVSKKINVLGKESIKKSMPSPGPIIMTPCDDKVKVSDPQF